MEIQQKILKFNELLEEMKKFIQPKREKTVFSIGGRGHYENPVSDVLAFFLEPREEHGFGTLFLSCFFEVLGIDAGNIADSTIEAVEREAVTPSGNRIDLVVVSEKWVLIIENKIYHSLANPLADYESYVSTKYKDKEPILAILSINEVTNVPSNWHSILYQQLISEIKKQSGPYLFSSGNAKWSFFLKDYILNLEELIGEQKVDKELINFAQKNYSKILELMKVKDHYIHSLKNIFSALLTETTGNQVLEKVHNWSERVAIRFYCPEKWGEKTNLVLVMLPQGDFKVYYYVYGIEASQQESENQKLLLQDFYHWKENKDTILCYKSENRFDLEGAKGAFTFAAQHLEQYFTL